jgi:hypothetical protein
MSNTNLAEWDKVNQAHLPEISDKLVKDYDEELKPSLSLISHTEVWKHFLNSDLTEEINAIDRNEDKGGIKSKLGGLFKKKILLKDELGIERDVFLALGKIKLETSQEIHDRLISSIYM